MTEAGRYLLDTHIFLWMRADPNRLGKIRDIVTDERNVLYLSAASSWEIAIKWAIGRLRLRDEPSSYVPAAMRDSAVDGLAITHHHALGVARLPPHHSDPFDRVLIAQAIAEGLTLLSTDSQFDAYPVQLLRP